MRTLDWYFDFVSPYSYLQCARFPVLPAGIDVRRKPVLLGALLDRSDPLEFAAPADVLEVVAPEARIADPAVKARLKSNTDDAIAAGVWGVPTFVVDGRCFWGFHAGDMLLDYLADPPLFSSAPTGAGARGARRVGNAVPDRRRRAGAPRMRRPPQAAGPRTVPTAEAGSPSDHRSTLAVPRARALRGERKRRTPARGHSTPLHSVAQARRAHCVSFLENAFSSTEGAQTPRAGGAF
jgi:hypothetical protein